MQSKLENFNKKKLVGERIRELRKNKGLSQQDLARLLGYSVHGQISKIENGESDIPVVILLKIREIFEINLHWLITGENPAQKALDDLYQTAQHLIFIYREDLENLIRDAEVEKRFIEESDLPEEKKARKLDKINQNLILYNARLIDLNSREIKISLMHSQANSLLKH